MPAKLYTLSLSHPSQAACLMLERKGIEHGRPAGDLAMRLLPDFPEPIPRALPV
jgi:hypothetical protein